MTTPSLQEIANLPFSETSKAIREHYDPKWGAAQTEGDVKPTWTVTADWTISGRCNFDIEADTKEDAIEIAKDWVLDDAYSGSVELHFCDVRALGVNQ